MTESEYPAPASRVSFMESTEEVIRIDNEGFHYRDQLIADAGEAHRLIVAFLQRQLSAEEPSEEWLEARENEMCKHSAWAEEGVLKLANNDDSYYVETFKSRQDLEQFIAYLRHQANEAWPL